MEWTEVSAEARHWLEMLGHFGPTVRAENRELKGYLGDEGRTYFDSSDLRNIAAAMIEAANWLDKRADAALAQPGDSGRDATPAGGSGREG